MAQRARIQGFLRLGVIATMVGCGPFVAGAQESQDKAPAALRSSATDISEPAAKPHASSEALMQPGLAGSFLSGRFARENKDLKEAAKYLSETLARDPENEILQKETMRMQLLAGDILAATDLAHQLEKTSATDPVVASLLMVEAVKTGDYARAKTIVDGASNAGLFGLVRPVISEWINVASTKSRKPVDLKAAIDKAGFFAPFINYHTALMNDVLGNRSAAQAAYAKANVDPSVTPYRVIEALANFYQRQGKADQAKALYDAYAKANPQSSLIPERLSGPGGVVHPLIPTARDGLAELYFTTASILFGEDSAQETFLYLRIALELRPDLPPAQLMLAGLYEQVGNYTQAIATYDSISEGSVFYRRAQVRKALNLEALEKREEALALLDDLSSRYPNDASPMITKGDMQRDAKQYDEAAESYSLAIERTGKLTNHDWPLLYARGICYERAGEWDLAEADFNRALTLEPGQPDVLNYLAYSWLTMNKNVAKAREYLDLAASARPNDPHIIDSVGWASFLNGDYKEAVSKFEQAIELMPDDPTVNDHLGDAYWRVGRETEARYQWERALTFKPDKDAAEAIRNKLNGGLPPQSNAASSSGKSKTSALNMRVTAETRVQ